MSSMASQITSLTIVYSTVYSDAGQRKHQSSASLAFAEKSPIAREFPAQMASNAENVSIWWRHHDMAHQNTKKPYTFYVIDTPYGMVDIGHYWLRLWLANCKNELQNKIDIFFQSFHSTKYIWNFRLLYTGRFVQSVVFSMGHALHIYPLHWRHNDHDSVSNHQPHGCLVNRLFRRRSKKTSKLRVTGLCVGNSPGPVNSPHKGSVTRKMFPFDDVIMRCVSTRKTSSQCVRNGVTSCLSCINLSIYVLIN